MKLSRSLPIAAFALATLSVLASRAWAASVGPAGYTNDFSSQPPAAHWSYLAVAGGSGDITTAAALNTAVQALTAAGITTQVVADSGNPPAMAGYATWSSTGGYLQTRPTGVKFIALMATFTNNTGVGQSSFQIGYTLSQQAVITEEINGHLVYYSLTGAANSWTNLPTLSSTAPGNLATNISAPWPKGGTLYLLWADDNGSPSPDTANQIDSFFLKPASVPPYIQSFGPPSATVNAGMPASFTVTAAGTAPLSYQWRKITATSTNLLLNQTNATYSVASASLADAAGYSVVITNLLGSVTSAVASLSVSTNLTFLPGQLMREFFLNIDFLDQGNNFGPLATAPNYPNSPDIREFISNLTGNQYYDNRMGGGTDNYAMRIAGHLLPPVSGTYTFLTYNDDSARFNLSPDQNASNAVTILDVENTCCASGGYTSSPVQLQADQPYFFELLMQQGGGAHYVHLQWQPPGSSSFQDIAITNLGYGYSVAIVQQPVSQSLPGGTPATFTVGLRLDGAAAEAGKTQPRWQRSSNGGVTWTNIPGANGTSLTVTYVNAQDNQAQFRFIADEPGTGLSVISAAATLTVTADNVPPYVAALVPALNGTNLFLAFSEPMDPTTTQNRSNYTLSDGPTVQSATLSPDGITLTLITTPMTPGAIYTLSVAGVLDRAQPTGNLITPNPTVLSFSPPLVMSGSVQREIWTGIATPPNYLAQLFNDPRYPSQPTYLDYIPTPFGSYSTNPTNNEYDSYGMRYAGHLIPSITGLYQFQVHADDSSRLRLSTDVQASNVVQLVIRDGSCCAYDLSPLVYLQAGQPYYFDAVMEEGQGNDYLEITWKPPGSTGFSLIPSANLAYVYNLTPGASPASLTVSNNSPATFTVVPGLYGAAQAEGKARYQWQRSGDGGSAWASIPGANGPSYTIAHAAQTDNGAQFRVQVSVAGTQLAFTSAPATLTVINVPYAVSLSVPDRRELYVYYSTNMDAATALDPSRYHINHGITVTNASFAPALGTNGPQSVVRLSVQPLIGFYSDYVLAITNVLGEGSLLPIAPDPTLLPFQLDYRNLGYLYLSPLPGAQYVSAQTRFVLVRFSAISPGAVTNLSGFITVTGSSSGIHSGQTHVAADGRTVIFQMMTDFTVNELVTVALNPLVGSGPGLDAYQYQFVVAGHLPDLGIVTARGENPPYQAKENAFDGDPATKWLDYIVPNGTSNFSWIQCLYPDNATLVAGQYVLVSANDAPERDPADWNFYGVDVSTNLVLLDRQTNQTFSSRSQTNTYTLTNVLAFRGYRLEITRVNNPSTATSVQLAELQVAERSGSLLREYWLNITGTAVSDLTNNANFPASPSGSSQISTFEAPQNWADNYGTRVRGFITAPNTGTFVFWISSDDNSQLFLSTDATPANKSLIASVSDWTNPREWTKYSEQKSAGISLTAGQKYYVEALQKEGTGGDNLAVGWAKPGQSTSSPSEVIPGPVLSPWTGAKSAPSLKLAGLQGAAATPNFATMPNGVSVPSDFPQVVITARGNPTPDYIWLENVGQNGQMYKMILDTWGNPVFYQRGGARDFKLQKNGTITWATFTAVDKNFNYLRSYGAVNGYGTDDHELVVMPDGSYFLIGGASQTVDMSRYVTGGNPTASVQDNVVQQFTAADELIFQWRAWDYMNILGQQQFIDLTAASFDFPHMNSIDVDDDGQILLSSRSSSECTKINRDTGEVIWRLGGAQGTLTFVNDPLNGPRQQHGFRALGHGHYILFDDGNLHSPSVSRAVEYAVDPVAKTASLVWQFRDTPDKYAYYMGNVQRLTNGNTHINWVLASYPKAVEVDSNGVKQLELTLTPGSDLYRSWRSPWDGVVPVPYLIAESYPDNVTLIFNKFGDTNVSYYRIYGGTAPQPTTLLATTPFTLAHLSSLQNNQTYYFRVTAVSGNGVESGYSNEENVLVNLVQPGQNMVLNGDFSSGTDNWIFVTNNAGAGSFSVVTGACLIHITSAGTALTDVQLRQSGLKLLQGKQHVLEFDGMAVGGTHAIDVKLGQDQSPFGIYYTASPTLRTVRQHFTYSFTMTNATDLDTRLMFNMGGLARDVVLDNISLYMAYDSQVTVTFATVPSLLTVMVDGTNYTAPASFTWATNSAHTLAAASAQLSADGHTRYPFLSWSDGGAQTHAVTTPLWQTNYTASFATEFLLDITLAPTNGGRVNPAPAGPWYSPNQTVSLTATPAFGFSFFSWSGVDNQSNNTAQATMSGFRNVTATFQPVGPIIIDAGSLARLPDGRVQFSVTAGPGATQATVWGTTPLSPPNWTALGTLPLTNGRGIFIGDPAPSALTRFYRVTVP